jgi:hypothetical protein
MTCPEYQRLLQVYEAALRRWEQAMWSSKAAAAGKPERLASEMKERAYFDRNEAHGQLRAHKESCLVCKSRLRVVPNP